jgi:hypothetical protein
VLDIYKVKRKKQAIKDLPGGRQRCKTKAGWEQKRKEAHDREQGLCERCMSAAPLHNTEQAYAGHAHHYKGRKVGDDRSSMLEWLCGRCHAVEHQPLKVVPRKFKGEAA